jgi:hypothetical protein
MENENRRLRRGATRLELGLLASTIGLLALMAIDIMTQSVARETQLIAENPSESASLSVIEYSVNHSKQLATESNATNPEAISH